MTKINVSVAVTPEQKERWLEAAKSRGMNTGQFIRHAVEFYITVCKKIRK